MHSLVLCTKIDVKCILFKKKLKLHQLITVPSFNNIRKTKTAMMLLLLFNLLRNGPRVRPAVQLMALPSRIIMHRSIIIVGRSAVGYNLVRRSMLCNFPYEDDFFGFGAKLLAQETEKRTPSNSIDPTFCWKL